VGPRYRAAFESLFCLSVLFLLPFGALLPAAVGTHVPMALQEPLFEAPWQDARPEGLEPGGSCFAREQSRRIYSEFAFVNRAARNYESLLWNPDEGAGTPFLAALRTRVFSPFTLPFHVMPLHQAIAWSLLLKMIAAGFCAWYVSRKFGFPAPLALLAAVAFQLSAPVFIWGAFPLADAAAWLPLLLMFAERLALGHYRAWPLGAVTVALMALGGDVLVFMSLMLFAFVYLALRARGQGTRGRLRGASAALLVTLALGLVLAGVQLVPYLEFINRGGVASAGQQPPLRAAHLAALLAPSIASSEGAGAAPFAALMHPGTVSLLLFALWFAVRQFVERPIRQRYEGLLLTFVLFAAAAIAASLAGWTAAVPGLLCMGGLVFAWVAAAALEEWHELNAEQCRAALGRLLWSAPVFWGVLFVLSLACASGAEGAAPAWRGEMAAAACMAVLVAVLLAVTLFRPNVRFAGYASAVLAGASLWWVLGASVPMTPAAEVFPETAFIRELRASQERISGSDALARWPLSAHGIPQLHNPGGVELDRYRAFMDIVKRDPLMLRRAGSRLLLLTKEDIQGDFASVRPMLGIRHVFASGAVLFEDREAKPRAWMAYMWRPVESFDPEIVGWDRLPTMETPLLPEQTSGSDAVPSVEMHGANNWIRVQVDTPRRGVLVLADAWYPGWQVTLDGVVTDSFPVDGLFRGVRVSEGVHVIEFRYQPQSFIVGLVLSGIAALIVVYGLGRLAHQRWRAAPSL